MNTSYGYETLARQRMEETARRASTAHQRRQVGARAVSWRFPKVAYPTRYRVTFTPRPA